MNWFRKLIRNVLASFAMSVPNFEHGKDEASAAPLEPITDSKHNYAPGGKLEKVDKYYGRTIAGGPGSQKIGDAFDALPADVRERMILARKGVIRRVENVDAIPDKQESTSMSGTDRIARALASGRYNYRGDRK